MKLRELKKKEYIEEDVNIIIGKKFRQSDIEYTFLIHANK